MGGAHFIRPAVLAKMIGMMSNIFHACMTDRPHLNDDRFGARWAEAWSHPVARSASAVTNLLEQLDKEPELPDDILGLFSGVLDAMRMNRENREKDAAAIFALVDTWLDARAAAGALNNAQKMSFCQCFIRAGLVPPDTIRINPVDSGSKLGMGAVDIPDIETLINDLIPDNVMGYPAYMALCEAIGAMPRDAVSFFVTQMIAQAGPKQVSIGRFFLLDPIAERRRAAAEGFVELAHAGAIDAAVLSDLIRLRKWVPDEKTKATLGLAVKEALRREAEGGAIPGPWAVHRLVTTLPDGTGSQSIMASVSRGSRKRITTLLLKAGHGIKDAYAIPCTSASDQRRTFMELEEAVPVQDVPMDYLPKAVAAALSEGLSQGHPPAPGFLEVAEMLGLSDIAPFEFGAVPLLEIADPDAQLAALSKNKRGRLIAQSIGWVRNHEITSSWFATDETLSTKLDEAKTERQAEQAVWAHLETQREFWSSLFARSAAIQRAVGSEDWLTFAAVVDGLVSNRALKRIPIFEMIAALTLDIAEQRSGKALAAEQDFSEGPFVDDNLELGIEPEKAGELGRLLQKTPLSPDMIDGYLTAVIVAPNFVTPTDWLPPLLGGIVFPGGNKLQRILDIIMLRYGAIEIGLYEEDIGSGIRKLSARKFEAWLSGFAQASDIAAAWPKRALSKDDKKILGLIKGGGQGDPIQDTLKPLLPSWLEILALKAADG